MLTNRTYMITATALITLLAWAPTASADTLKDQLMKGSIISYSLFKHDGDVKPGRAMALVAAPAEEGGTAERVFSFAANEDGITTVAAVTARALFRDTALLPCTAITAVAASTAANVDVQGIQLRDTDA